MSLNASDVIAGDKLIFLIMLTYVGVLFRVACECEILFYPVSVIQNISLIYVCDAQYSMC